MRPKTSGEANRIIFPKLKLPRELVKEAPTKGFDEEEVDTIVPDEEVEQTANERGLSHLPPQPASPQAGEGLSETVPGRSPGETVSRKQPQVYGSHEMTPELPPEHPFSQENLARRQMASSRSATNRGAQAVRRTADAGRKYAQNAADNIKKKLTREAIKAAIRTALAPIASYFGISILAAAGLVLAIIAGIIALAIGISIAWTQLHQTPSASGQTMNQPVGPVVDKDFLQKFLLLTGDKNIQTEILSGKVDDIINNLHSLQTELALDKYNNMPQRSQLLASLTELEGLLNNTKNPSSDRKKLASQIQTKLTELTKTFNPCGELVRIAREGKTIIIRNENELNGLESNALPRSASKDQTRKTPDPAPPVTPDARMCQLIVAFSTNLSSMGIEKIIIGNFTNHVRFVAARFDPKKGENNVESRHWTGHAFDISNEDIGDRLEKWIYDNRDTLIRQGIMPNQVIGPSRFAKWSIDDYKPRTTPWSASAQRTHEDHIHIGY